MCTSSPDPPPEPPPPPAPPEPPELSSTGGKSDGKGKVKGKKGGSDKKTDGTKQLTIRRSRKTTSQPSRSGLNIPTSGGSDNG